MKRPETPEERAQREESSRLARDAIETLRRARKRARAWAALKHAYDVELERAIAAAIEARR